MSYYNYSVSYENLLILIEKNDVGIRKYKYVRYLILNLYLLLLLNLYINIIKIKTFKIEQNQHNMV